MSLDPAEAGPSHVNTAIVGNGPSALILSFLLNGNVPTYSRNHDDEHLHQHLLDSADLLHLKSSVFDHVRSSLKYSSQALPINVVLDALQRPDRDVSDAPATCIKWLADPVKAVDHIVLGEAPRPGGQWTENPVASTWSIGTLSYAEQLSLPGWSFADYWESTHRSALPDFTRPSRTDVASYYAAYPDAVGITSRINTSAKVYGVSRVTNGFHIASHNLSCDNIVLATGTFSINLPPPRSLSPLSSSTFDQGPVLIIGSGFTAADLIISTPPSRKIIHVYNWNPENKPSPLQGCHSQAYPEYAWIFRQMKLAAARQGQDKGKLRSAKFKAVSELPHFNDRDWSVNYEGFANADVFAAPSSPSAPESSAAAETARIITMKLPSGDAVKRSVTTLHYATGRRGSLSYLSNPLLHEVLSLSSRARPSSSDPDPWNGPADSRPPSHNSPHASSSTLPFDAAVVSGSTLRPKLEECGGMEVAPSVFVVGSLTGDSLVRFALGGCCAVAGQIFDRAVAAAKAAESHQGEEKENGQADGLSASGSMGNADVSVLPGVTGPVSEEDEKDGSRARWSWSRRDSCACVAS